jgi:aspartate aminotransferase-like enzyme
LIPISSDVNNNSNNNTNAMTTIIANERILQQLKELGIDVRRITKEHQENFLQNSSSNNNLTLLIVDQSSYLTVELSNDDDNTKGETLAEEQEDAIILATYSNTEATVFAYVSIFENLWMKTQA